MPHYFLILNKLILALRVPTFLLPINKLQEASTIFDKEGPGFEHYPCKELDSIVSLEEAYQPSPVSVLEPLFKEETISSSESSGINSRGCLSYDYILIFKFIPSYKHTHPNLFWL